MFTKRLISAAVMTSAMLVGGLASAATVTLNPSGNGVQAGGSVIAPFDTTGGALVLGNPSNQSVLTIAGNSGGQSFTETGTIYVTSLSNGSNNVAVGGEGQPGNYSLFATYNISGGGIWTGGSYTVDPSALIFNLNLFALAPNNSIVTLGTASYLANPTNYAFALFDSGVANNTSGHSTTALGATLGFNPAAGTTGPGNFFQAPIPFDIGISFGALGGNVNNTTYSVSNSGVVTVVTPIANQSVSTGNFTFSTTSVPEPNALSLAGIALVGLAFVVRRKASKNI